MALISLLGGGWDALDEMYGPFLDGAGSSPTVACVVLDEGDGHAEFRRWHDALRSVATCDPVPVLVPLGGTLDVAVLGDADALLVCGGLTPAYADALAPAAGEIASWLADRPYAGFSAGAAIASRRAVVGGWLRGGVPVCPDDAAENLDEVALVAGLALVEPVVDTHCAQWGTLPRLISVVDGSGLALDENTALHLDGGTGTVAGRGLVREVRTTRDGVAVSSLAAGARLTLEPVRR